MGGESGGVPVTRSSAPIALTKKDRHELKRLLGKLQTFLESAIQTTLAPGETEPREAIDQAVVALDRREWQRAETWVKRLEGGA